MNDKLLRELLHEIAEQEIKDDMNLWPKIQSQLNAPVSRRTRSTLSILKFAIVLILTLVVSAAAFAIYQGIRMGDSGLNAVNEENLVTHLNLTQVVDGITVTLNYAYADANRIVVDYAANGTAEAEENIASFVFQTATLSDDRGHEFVGLNGSGGGGGGGGGGSEPGGLTSFSAGMQSHYDASIIEDAPEELNLRLELAFGVIYMDGSAAEPTHATFEFTIPFNAGTTIDTAQTISASDIDMTLRKVVIAPSLTRLELCYDAPAPVGREWTVYGKLAVNGAEIVTENQLMGATAAPLDDGTPCWALSMPEALDKERGDWALTITALRIVGSEDREAVAEILARDYGIRVTLEPSGGYSYDTPAEEGGRQDISERLGQVILEHLESINGPWVFEFEVR